MAKIVAFGEFQSKKNQETFEANLQTEIEKVEKKLGLENEPLLVLTDMNALTIGNCLLDAKNWINNNVIYKIDKALEILGIDESEEIPYDE